MNQYYRRNNLLKILRQSKVKAGYHTRISVMRSLRSSITLPCICLSLRTLIRDSGVWFFWLCRICLSNISSSIQDWWQGILLWLGFHGQLKSYMVWPQITYQSAEQTENHTSSSWVSYNSSPWYQSISSIYKMPLLWQSSWVLLACRWLLSM